MDKNIETAPQSRVDVFNCIFEMRLEATPNPSLEFLTHCNAEGTTWAKGRRVWLYLAPSDILLPECNIEYSRTAQSTISSPYSRTVVIDGLLVIGV